MGRAREREWGKVREGAGGTVCGREEEGKGEREGVGKGEGGRE